MHNNLEKDTFKHTLKEKRQKLATWKSLKECWIKAVFGNLKVHFSRCDIKKIVIAVR